jgi:hypothetical protein
MCSNGNTVGKNGKLKTQVQKTEPGARGAKFPTASTKQIANKDWPWSSWSFYEKSESGLVRIDVEE